MEEQQSLRQLTVVQSLGLQHIGSNGLEFTLGNECLDALAFVLLADGIERLVEGKFLNAVEILLLEVGGRHVVIGVDEGEHILEHTAGGS